MEKVSIEISTTGLKKLISELKKDLKSVNKTFNDKITKEKEKFEEKKELIEKEKGEFIVKLTKEINSLESKLKSL